MIYLAERIFLDTCFTLSQKINNFYLKNKLFLKLQDNLNVLSLVKTISIAWENSDT